MNEGGTTLRRPFEDPWRFLLKGLIMELGLKKEYIFEILEQEGLSVEDLHCVYANKIHYGSSRASYFLLVFTKEGVSIWPIDAMGTLSRDKVLVTWDQVESYEWKKGLLAYKFLVKTKEQTYSFRVNRIMVGVSWQKEELQALLATNYDQKKKD